MKLALDTASKRRIDENGFLHVSISNISKECVSAYYGYEIPNYQEVGLDGEKIYYAYRKGEELDKGSSTFNGLPLLSDHYIEHAENPQKEYRIGSLGTDATFSAPYLTNSLIVTDAEAIRKIESGACVELSAAYMYTPIFESGIFEGQEYDFIMTNIRGNHVALVANGRAGSDVFVADSKVGGLETMPKKSLSEDDEEFIQIAESIDDDIAELKEELKEKNEEIQDTTEAESIEKSSEEGGNPVQQEVLGEFRKQIMHNLPHYIQSIRVLNQLLEALTALDEEIKHMPKLDTSEASSTDKESEKKAHTAMDFASYRAKIKEEVYAEMRHIDTALSHCLPLVGQLDDKAFDSADLVYLQACKLLELSADRKSAKDVIMAISGHSKKNYATDSAQKVENAGFMSRFQ